MNEGHLQELMLEHAVPPPAPPGSSAVSLVRMGFPPRNPEAPGAAAFCGGPEGRRGAAARVMEAGCCPALPLLLKQACPWGFSDAQTAPPSRTPPAGEGCLLQPGGYTCPRCRARVTELPSQCHVCGLSLVASPHLARSYHHLFPVKPFSEVSAAELAKAGPVSARCAAQRWAGLAERQPAWKVPFGKCSWGLAPGGA